MDTAATPRTELRALHFGKPVTLAVEQITHFRADSKYVVAHHPGGELLLSEPLAGLESEFAERFVRIHRNTLVARHRMLDLTVQLEHQGGELRVEGVPEPLRVSRRHLKTVRRALEQEARP